MIQRHVPGDPRGDRGSDSPCPAPPIPRGSRGGGPWGALLLAVLVSSLGLVVPSAARAATRTVTLTGNGPSPAAITINAGDRVAFVNSDNSTHTITDNAGPWSFRATIQPGGSATTSAFSTAGHYGYNDAFFVAVVQQNAQGAIEVKAAVPAPTTKPTTKPTLKPTPSRTPSPSASPSATHSPSPTPSASGSPTPAPSATATIGLGAVPVVTLPPSTGPTPAVAPPLASPSPSVSYGPVSQIAQSSAHRYGLPVLLALLAAAGVLSLLVRFLLAVPDGPASRRTGSAGVVDGTDG